MAGRSDGNAVATLAQAAAGNLAVGRARTRDDMRPTAADGDGAPATSTRHLRTLRDLTSSFSARVGLPISVPSVRTDGHAREVARAYGAPAVVAERSIHLDPRNVDPDTALGRRILAHEVTHLAQQHLAATGGRRGSVAAAEKEADRVGAALAEHTSSPPVRVGLAPDARPTWRPPDDTGTPPQTEISPDGFLVLPGPVLRVEKLWYERNFGATRQNAEQMALVLGRLATEMPWIADLTPEQRQDAARRMTLTAPFAPGEDTAMVRISEEIYRAIGLPPGTDVVWTFPEDTSTRAGPPATGAARPPDGGDDAPRRMAELYVRASRLSPTEQGRGERRMSPGLAIEIVESLERATSLWIDPAVRSEVIARFARGVFDDAGALTFGGPAPRELSVVFFGEPNWRAFERRLAGLPASAAGAVSGQAGSSIDPALDPATQQYALRWMREAFAPGTTGGGPPMLITATVVETMREIDASPERERILDRLRHPGQSAAQPSSLAEQLRKALNATRLDAEYARLGIEPSAETQQVIFNRPVEGEIVNHSDLLFIGKKAEFSFRTTSRDDALAIPWVDVTWIVRDTAVRETSAPILERDHTRHRDYPGEAPDRFDFTFDRRGTYEVNALVAHRFYLPSSFTIFVEVKTENERLAELSHRAFDQPGGMFADVIQSEPHIFGDASFTDTHDRGHIVFGRLATQSRPEDHLPIASPTAPIDDRIRRIHEYIESGRATSSQLTAARDYLHQLRVSRDSLRGDERLGARVVYIQGVYLSRTARARSQELQLVANARRHDQNWQFVVYDVTQAFDSRNSRFQAERPTYQAAAEDCFVRMCKSYPTGRMVVRLETLDDDLSTTGNFVGFEADCTSTWEEFRSVVWNPTVQLVVNIAGTVVMIFLPVTAPILIPALIAYNGIETVATLGDYYERDAVHTMDVVMGLGQLAMDLIPYVGRVGRLVKVGGRSYHVMERLLIAGDVALIGAQAIEELQELRFGIVREAADLNAQIEERERNNPSDPQLPELRQRFAELQQSSQDAWAKVAAGIVKNQLIMRAPSHVATHLAAIHEGRIQESRGVLGEALRSRAGEHVRDADVLHLQRVMGVDVDTIPNSGDVKIAYDVSVLGGITKLRVQVGDRASLAVVLHHEATLAAMRRYAGLTGSLRAVLARVEAYRRGDGHIPVGSPAFEAHFELLKLPPLIERFHAQLAGLPLNDAVRVRIEAQIASLEAQLEHHARRLDDVAEGLGYVAALERPPEAAPSGRPSAEEQPVSRPQHAHPETGEQVRGDRLPPPREGAADPRYRELLRLRGHDRALLRPRPQGWTGRQEAEFRWGKETAELTDHPGYHWSITPDGEPNLVRDRLYDERGDLVPPLRYDPEGRRFVEVSDAVERARLSEGARFEPSAQTASEQQRVLAQREAQRTRRDTAEAEVERLREQLGLTDEQLSADNFDETIARLRREHAGNPETLRVIDGLEAQRTNLAQARHQVSQASMQIGQLMGHDWVMRTYPTAELIHGGVGSASRSGDFDAVYVVPRGEGQRPLVLIVEAKGGSSTLGTRGVGGQTTQQGTRRYMLEIARLMGANEQLPARTREVMDDVYFGEADVRYVLVEAPIGTQGGRATLQSGRARDFDVASP